MRRVLVFGSQSAALALMAALLSAAANASVANDDIHQAIAPHPPTPTFTIIRPDPMDLPVPTLAPSSLPALPSAPRQLGCCQRYRAATPTNPNGPHTGPPRR